MAVYSLPQAVVFQDFLVAPAAAVQPLRACLIGGAAELIRYDDAEERVLGRLGYYDPFVDEDYSWPNRPAGGIVDQDYTKVFIRDALLRYYEDDIAGGSTVTKTAANKVRSATINFAENTATYPRAAALIDRDVQPGDIVKVYCVPDVGDPFDLWTYVKDLVGDPTSATTGTSTADAANETTQVASAAVETTDGPDNCITVAADASAYDGYPSGYVDETYEIIVVNGSVGGDLETATIRVISASGTDDVDDFSPEPAGDPTPIGTRGLFVTFDVNIEAGCTQDAEDAGVSESDLVAGQIFTAEAHGAFTSPTTASGGTYTGTADTTYIVTVTAGNLFATGAATLMVTTTNGTDISGPHSVTASAQAVSIGNFGVTFTPTGTGLRTGDRWTIACVASVEGPMRTIVLGHSIPSSIDVADQVGLTLYIKQTKLEVEQNRAGFAPLTNWDQTTTQITLNSGIVAYEATWTDGGVPQALDVVSEEDKDYGVAYVEVRYWIPGPAAGVVELTDVDGLDDLPGPLSPDNPLKYAAYKAIQNAKGTAVKAIGVTDPSDVDAWGETLEKLVGVEECYGLVPLSKDATVVGLVQAHVAAMSAAEEGLWRVLWTSLEGIPEIPMVADGSTVPGYLEATTTDGEVALATIADDPDTSGTQYTLLTCTSDNAPFVELGVRPGDVVRALYTGDGFGGFTYTEYVVDSVPSENQLLLLAGPGAPISVPAKFEVWRTHTATEEAAAIGARAGAFGDRRVRAVWPDSIEADGATVEGYHLCAALAGLSSGVVPHQGLTNVAVLGFTSVGRTTGKFNRAQLNTMAGSGVWIVTQDPAGRIYNRHALTTGSYDDINQREEMVTRNVDSISYRFRDQFAPYIGLTNVTPSMEANLRTDIKSLVEVLKTESFTTTLGGQLVDATVLSFKRHATLRDRYVLFMQLVLPYPLNNVEVHLVV